MGVDPVGNYTMDDPDRTGTKSVDGQGRLYLGDEYAGEDVEFAVKKADEE